MGDNNNGRLTDEPPVVRKGRFRGGPLDGQTRMIPHHGPAYIRYWEQGGTEPHWYTIVSKHAKGTYQWQGHGNRHALEIERAGQTDESGLLAQLGLIRPAGESGLLELRALCPGRKPVQEWFTDPRQFASRAQALREERDVYVGAAVRARKGGTKEDLTRSWCLWVDCDNPGSQARLINFDPPPTLIVNSGGGFHAWWRLSQPLSRDQLEPALERLQATLDADGTAVDAARILRVVSTFNRKPEYRSPREVTVVEYVNARVYTVDEAIANTPHPAAADVNAKLGYQERRAVLHAKPARGPERLDRHPTLRNWVGRLVNTFPDAPDFVKACALGLNDHLLDPPKPKREVLALVRWTFEKHYGDTDA
jgi:hypothetical protein